MPERDQQLVAAALDGSEDAYRDLLREYQRPVFSIIVRLVRDAGLAEDLAQESFLKAFRALASFDRQRKFSSWLFTIAHNTAIDALRKKRLVMVPLEINPDDGGEPSSSPLDRLPDHGAESPETAVLRQDMAAAFEDCLTQLRPQYAEILVLRFREGLSYEEISEITGLPLGTVKTHLFRARKSMAQKLRRCGFGPPNGG